MWSKTQEFPSPEQPIVSQQATQPLVDQVVEPISALVDPTLLSESDPYLIEPMSPLVIPLSFRRVTFTKQLNRFQYRSIPLFLWRVKCLLETFSSLPVQNLLKKGALDLLWIKPHQALELLPLIGIA